MGDGGAGRAPVIRGGVDRAEVIAVQGVVMNRYPDWVAAGAGPHRDLARHPDLLGDGAAIDDALNPPALGIDGVGGAGAATGGRHCLAQVALVVRAILEGFLGDPAALVVVHPDAGGQVVGIVGDGLVIAIAGVDGGHIAHCVIGEG